MALFGCGNSSSPTQYVAVVSQSGVVNMLTSYAAGFSGSGSGYVTIAGVASQDGITIYSGDDDSVRELTFGISNPAHQIAGYLGAVRASQVVQFNGAH